MGGKGSGWNKKAAGTHFGHRGKAQIAKDHANAAATVEAIKKIHPSIGSPQPVGNDAWDPRVQAWWKAVGLSYASQVYQPLDWMNAYIACDVLHQLYEFGFQSGLYQVWQNVAESLHAPMMDALAEEPEAELGAEPEADDPDAAAAEASLDDVVSQLRLA